MKSQILNRTMKIIILSIMSIMTGYSHACDTWVALKNATKNGNVILAKNSDRTLFDCQPLMFHPRTKWTKGSEVDLGRIKVPQVKETYATMGSSPYWCWGYEEGINEFGVAIGNEGIWTKPLSENIEAQKKGGEIKLGPTGMDLLRLGLERGKTAKEALNVITTLLEKYGQFGSGVPTVDKDGAYNNSFIIADPNEAWVLETAGNKWIAKKFEEGVTSISNKISITTDWDKASKDLIDYAIRKDWWEKDQRNEFNFEKAYTDKSLSKRGQARRAKIRANCSQNLLMEQKEKIDVSWMKRIARDRSTNPSLDLDQTASSCVAILPKNKNELPVFWWCPSVPSSSCYIPFFIHGEGLPKIISNAGTFGRKITPPSKVQEDQFSEESYWWLFRDLANLVKADYENRNSVVRATFDSLEIQFEKELPNILQRAVQLRQNKEIKKSAKYLSKFSATCLEKVLVKLNELRQTFRQKNESLTEKFKPYLGKYTANFGPFQNTEFTCLIQDGLLAVDVPGQRVYTLNSPDEEGIWHFSLTNLAGTSFAKDSIGKVIEMKMHQTTPVQRKENKVDSLLINVPDKYFPYIGKYVIPVQNKVVTVKYQNNNLAIEIPGEGTPELKEPDAKGKWYFTDTDAFAVSFNKDDSGTIMAMNFHQIFWIPKGKCAALVLEKEIENSSLKQAIEKYQELRINFSDAYVFSERGLNSLGYKLLGKDKIDEAIGVFKINVNEHPESFNVYDSIGEAFMKKGDNELAIQNYQKSLELNPKNENAQKMLKKLIGKGNEQ
ncbi:C69 family dipeptidase [candidate division KSB1 bacterium]|nr:C69 family dipeptidase [candidate division KSB1 bacterium]